MSRSWALNRVQLPIVGRIPTRVLWRYHSVLQLPVAYYPIKSDVAIQQLIKWFRLLAFTCERSTGFKRGSTTKVEYKTLQHSQIGSKNYHSERVLQILQSTNGVADIYWIEDGSEIYPRGRLRDSNMKLYNSRSLPAFATHVFRWRQSLVILERRSRLVP